MPPVSVRDNLELEPTDYRFLLRGKSVARGQLMPGRWLAMNVSGSKVRLKGVPTREPVFNLDATWIDEPEKKTAEINGFTVVDPASVLITHLSETLKLESRFPDAVIAELRRRGHVVEVLGAFVETMGHAGALVRHPDGVLEGGFDPRGDGCVAGY